MPRILRNTLFVVGSVAALWLLAGAALALAPAPRFSRPPVDLAVSASSPSLGVPRRDDCGLRTFQARDGVRLAARQLTGTGELTVLLLHGVLGSSAELEDAARLLHESTGASVIRLDLRGHGLSAGRPGDVDHIGQYEDDVADVVGTLRREHPTGRLVLAGHSMGGGVALRYASHRAVPGVDGYLLFAPLLGMRSPTERREPATGSAETTEPFLKVHVPRLVGLAMLNGVGVRCLNSLGTLYFNVGRGFPIRTYTFRAVASMAPDDYRVALAADAKPMLVLVGRNDEAFRTGAYPAVIALHRNGRTVLIEGESHDGVTRSPVAFAAVEDWVRCLRAPA